MRAVRAGDLGTVSQARTQSPHPGTLGSQLNSRLQLVLRKIWAENEKRHSAYQTKAELYGIQDPCARDISLPRGG